LVKKAKGEGNFALGSTGIRQSRFGGDAEGAVRPVRECGRRRIVEAAPRPAEVAASGTPEGLRVSGA